MPELSQEAKGEEPVDSVDTGESSTMRTSQSEQVHGYLESLTKMDYIAELQSALENAQRLTSKDWKIVVTSEKVAIESDKKDGESKKRIKIPKPKSLKN